MEQRLEHQISQLPPGCMPTHLPNELSEFVSADMPPMDDKPVLCIRLSGVTTCKYELITACYHSGRANPWRTLDGECATASGHPVLGWKNALRWLQAR